MRKTGFIIIGLAPFLSAAHEEHLHVELQPDIAVQQESWSVVERSTDPRFDSGHCCGGRPDCALQEGARPMGGYDSQLAFGVVNLGDTAE